MTSVEPFSRIRQRFQQPGFLANTLLLTGGTALGQAVAVVTLPLITRLYTPVALGQLGLFLSFMSFATTGVCLRYETAIVTPANSRSAARLTVSSMLLSIPVAAILAGVLGLLRHEGWLGFAGLPVTGVWLMAPTLVLTGTFTALRYWLIRTGQFQTVSMVTLYQNSARAVTQIVTGFFGLAWPGLLAGEVVGRASGMGSMLRRARRQLLDEAFPITAREYLKDLREQRKFPLLYLPSSLLNALASNLTLPLTAYLYGDAAAGLLALVQRALALPMTVVGQSVADSYHAQLAIYHREQPEQMHVFFRRTARGLLLLGIGPTLFLMVVGPLTFAGLFGSQWRVAGLMAAAMAPFGLAQFVVSPLSRAVLVLSGQEFKLVYDIVSLMAVCGSMMAAHSANLGVVAAMATVSAAQVISYVVYYLLLDRLVARHSEPSSSSPKS